MLTMMILRVLLTILRHDDERSFSGSRDVQVIEVEAAGMKVHGVKPPSWDVLGLSTSRMVSLCRDLQRKNRGKLQESQLFAIEHGGFLRKI